MMSERKVPVLDVKGRRMKQKSPFPGAGMEGAGRREGGRARGPSAGFGVSALHVVGSPGQQSDQVGLGLFARLKITSWQGGQKTR